jgi:hypothetical protein
VAWLLILQSWAGTTVANKVNHSRLNKLIQRGRVVFLQNVLAAIYAPPVIGYVFWLVHFE